MIPIYNAWCICVMHDTQIVLMWTTSNFALHYSYKYYIIIHIYIIILYHFVYIISVNTKTSLPLHNLNSKIIVWRWSQIEALLVTNRAGSQIEALCGHKSCRSHKLKRVTNRAVTPWLVICLLCSFEFCKYSDTLQWRHIERDGISNHWRIDLLHLWFRWRSKKNIKAPYHWPMGGEFTGDRWTPRTKGQ